MSEFVTKKRWSWIGFYRRERVCVPWMRGYATIRDDRNGVVVDAPVETVANT
jgi:hypothetical protein